MILFVDTISPQPYHPEIIEQAKIGASEKTAMMIAEYLGRSDDVIFAQKHNVNFQSKYVKYCNLKVIPSLKPDIIVIIRNATIVGELYANFRNSKLVLVLDDIYNPETDGELPCNIPIKIVTKSDWHLKHIKECFMSHRKIFADAIRIYNPIMEINPLQHPKGKVNINHLLFASSPHKGLQHAINLFRFLKQNIPSLKLYVANPGYRNHSAPKIDGVVYLDKLPYKELLKYMKTSLCVFAPNIEYPETFGCVMAEAHYVGTPVLAHDLGAMSEILTKDEIVDCRNPQEVLDKIVDWRMKRPVVRMSKEYTIESVGDEWIKMFGDIYKDDMPMELEYTKDQELKVLFVTRTNLANAPKSLADSINKYTNIKCDINNKPIPGYHIIHFHNIYIPCKHSKTLLHYHSEPTRVSLKKHFEDNPLFPENKVVISQYHATLEDFSDCFVVKNLLEFDTELYKIKRNTNTTIRVGYSPSITQKANEYYNKGFQETIEIFKKVASKRKIEFDVIHQVSYEECIRRKSLCDIIIDECVTGSYHRSGLEGLALGKVAVCWMKEDVEKLIPGIPFENIHISDLEEWLMNLPEDKKDLHEKGLQNRIWMNNNWYPKKIVEEYVSIYDKILRNEKINRQTKNQ